MIYSGKSIKIFAGNSHPDLSVLIAKKLNIPLSMCEVGKFSDGEIAITIGETVRGSDVFLIQSTSTPVNDNLMELLIMIDACKRASAGRITAVMPYFGYARQDRKTRARDPISSKLVANLLTAAGADRILTMDLHAPQLQGFFDIPVDNMMGTPLLVPHLVEKFGISNPDLVVVSPDLGSVTRARKFSDRLDCTLAIVDKRRPKANVSEVMNIIGDVKDKTVILVDDLIDTAGTLVNAASALVEKGGAKEIYACATHGVLSGEAIERIDESIIKEVILLDTIPASKVTSPKISYITTAEVLAEAIARIYEEKAISTLFN